MTDTQIEDDERVEDLWQVIAVLNVIADVGISTGTLHVGDPVTSPRIEERIARMDDEEMKMFRQRANGKKIGSDFQLDWNEDRQGYDLGKRVELSVTN